MRPPDLFKRVKYIDGRRRTLRLERCVCAEPRLHPSDRHSRRICILCSRAILDAGELAFARSSRLGDFGMPAAIAWPEFFGQSQQ